VEAINNAISVYDTLGNLVSGPEALSQFFGLTPEIDRTLPWADHIAIVKLNHGVIQTKGHNRGLGSTTRRQALGEFP